MKQPRRNDPCPCGSGKRYKHCHGSLDSTAGLPELPFNDELAAIVAETSAFASAERSRRERTQGAGNPIVSVDFNGNRVIAVRDRIMSSPTWKTFHDFLSDYIKSVLGPEWGNEEIAKALEKRHPILQWYDAACAYQREFIKEPGKVHSARGSGGSHAWLWLAYDLYCIDHNLELQTKFLERLRNSKGFPGARYELSVAATLVRAGFELEYENEDDRRSTHCEFTATAPSGSKFSVECKRRDQEDGGHELKLSKLGRKLHRANKAAPHNRIVFLDLNVPDQEQSLEMPQWLKLALHQIRKFERNAVNGGSLPPAYLFITNHPHHHHLRSTLVRTTVFLEGFKIDDCKADRAYRSVREAVDTRDRHPEIHELLSSIRATSTVPHRFDSSLAEFGEGVASIELKMGQDYMHPDKHKNKMLVRVMGIGVDLDHRVLRCQLVSGAGKEMTEDWPMSEDEFQAASISLPALMQRFAPAIPKLNDAVEVYDLILRDLAGQPRAKVLERCANQQDFSALATLPHDQLLKAAAERLTNTVLVEAANRKAAAAAAQQR